MKKSLSSEEILKNIEEGIREATKDLLFKPITQNLVNSIRHHLDQIFCYISNDTGINYREHIGFDIIPKENKMLEIKLFPLTPQGEMLLLAMKEFEEESE